MYAEPLADERFPTLSVGFRLMRTEGEGRLSESVGSQPNIVRVYREVVTSAAGWPASEPVSQSSSVVNNIIIFGFDAA